MPKFKSVIDGVEKEHNWQIQPDMFGGKNEYFFGNKKAFSDEEINRFILHNFQSANLLKKSIKDIEKKMTFKTNPGDENSFKDALINRFGKDLNVTISPKKKLITVKYLIQPEE